MKKLSVLVLLSILLIVLGLPGEGVGASPFQGSSTSCQSYATAQACRTKGISDLGSSYSATVISYMTNPTINIGTIGYSWWTVREKCTGIITYQAQYGGGVNYNSSYYSRSTNHSNHTCSPPNWRIGYSMGNHDFNDSGSSHIYPYKEYSADISG